MTAPTVWALLGEKRGDNAQILALAGRLGARLTRFELRHNLLREAPNLLLGGSRASIRGRRPRFAPPWPDLVIAAGRRSSPAARWIKRESGGGTRLVHLGRPRAPLAWFDLVIATPQYGAGTAPNLLRNVFPVLDGGDAPLEARKGAVVVLGGVSWTAATSPAMIDELAAAALAGERPLTVFTSPRTPKAAAERIERLVGDAALVRRFDPAGDGGAYRAALASARQAFVTGDSVSMIADAVAAGCETVVFPTPERRWLRAARALWPETAARWLTGWGNAALLAPPPNLPAFMEALAAEDGVTRDAAGRLTVAANHGGPARDADRAAAAVRRLLASPVGGEGGHSPAPRRDSAR